MTSSCSRSTLRHDHDHHQLRSGGGDGARDNGKKRPPTMAAAAAAAMPKMMKRATVVYYLTRNGQLEHPHFMEVAHLPSLPLRLRGTCYTQNTVYYTFLHIYIYVFFRPGVDVLDLLHVLYSVCADVMDRLTSLRGKGMPSMYSWSCKRSSSMNLN